MSDDKRARIVAALKSTIDGTYKGAKQKITAETVESSYQKYFKLLKGLPAELRPFAELTETVLQRDKYDIVWLGMKLHGIYKGHDFLPLLCRDQQLEKDFYSVCQQMLNRSTLIVTALRKIIKDSYPVTKQEIAPDTVQSSYQKYFKLLSDLPAELMPFRELAEAVLQRDKYDIVWLGMKLQGIYLGKNFLPLLCSDWELEADFYNTCLRTLKTQILTP